MTNVDKELTLEQSADNYLAIEKARIDMADGANDPYELYLKGRVTPSAHDSFNVMLHILYLTEFYWLIPNDENRAKDGILLREKYLLEEGSNLGLSFNGDYDFEKCTVEERIADWPLLVPQGPCRVLEMVISVADRMAFNVDDGESGDVFGRIFWELMKNLGLWGYNDRNITPQKCSEVYKKVENLLDRRYSPRGKGGLFPVKRVSGSANFVPTSNLDQRTVEIAKQMDAYVQEKRREKVPF